MKHQEIKVGMLLRLKKERARAYGANYYDLIKVTAIRVTAHYKTPWIMSGKGAYKPSDFERPILLEKTMKLERSKGSLGFVDTVEGLRELIVTTTGIVAAPVDNVIDLSTGRRVGRFLAKQIGDIPEDLLRQLVAARGVPTSWYRDATPTSWRRN